MLVKSSTETRLAPAADQFPAWPATWYLFCRAAELRDRPLSKMILGRRLVAYRTATGKVTALGAHCAHQGADLGRGTITGETIQCPYHHWRYDTEGRCVSIPGTRDIPEFACQPVYPVVERHGHVFFFNGPEPLFPLPFFPDEDPADFVAGRGFTLNWEFPWYMIVANGFDAQHFRAVHDRKMVGNEMVDSPAPFARRIRFDAQVTGESLHDRLLRAVIGERVEISITSWGGPFVMVTGKFRRATSYILIALQPLDASHTITETIVHAPRGVLTALWLRRLLTQTFMRDDFNRLAGISYNPRTFIESDRVMVEFLHWLAALPQTKENP